MPIGTSDGLVYDDPFSKTVHELGLNAETQAKNLSSHPEVGIQGDLGSDSGGGVGEDSNPISNALVGSARAVMGIPQHIVDQVKDVMTTDPESDEGIGKITNLALGLLGGGTTFAQKGALGLFGGRMTQAATKQAERMEQIGISDHSIKEFTGLERGADNMWRKEFSDSESVYKPKGFQIVDDGAGHEVGEAARLGDILKHDNLYKAYPEAKDIAVFRHDKIAGYEDAYGVYYPESQSIDIKSGLGPDKTKEVLLHEVQHWIQHKEGFNEGSGAELKVTPALLDQYKQSLAAKHNVKIDDPFVEDRLYRNIAGEQEAFNTGTRIDIPAKNLKSLLGRDTEDVQRSHQLVVKNPPAR